MIFAFGLFINAALFVPQIVKILKEKSAKGVSLSTFLGFWLIQIFIVLHAVLVKDYLLLVGYLLSIITCGMVVFLIILYRNN
jgi:MtN3 and saliva related transmembrane protein